MELVARTPVNIATATPMSQFPRSICTNEFVAKCRHCQKFSTFDAATCVMWLGACFVGPFDSLSSLSLSAASSAFALSNLNEFIGIFIFESESSLAFRKMVAINTQNKVISTFCYHCHGWESTNEINCKTMRCAHCANDVRIIVFNRHKWHFVKTRNSECHSFRFLNPDLKWSIYANMSNTLWNVTRWQFEYAFFRTDLTNRFSNLCFCFRIYGVVV